MTTDRGTRFRASPVTTAKDPSAREIRAWPWDRAEALGWALPPEMLVLDVDVKSGQQGMAHLRGLEVLVCPLPPTRSQATPSVEEHGYRLPRGVNRFAAPVAFPDEGEADIDILHSGNRFLVRYDERLFDQDIAVLPEAWIPLLEKRRLRRVNRHQSNAGTKAGAGLDALDRLPQAKEGTRNRTLYEVVLDLRLRGLWGENAEVTRPAAGPRHRTGRGQGGQDHRLCASYRGMRGGGARVEVPGVDPRSAGQEDEPP